MTSNAANIATIQPLEMQSFSLRPLGLAKSFRNITLTINGTSMSSRCESWIGAAEALWYDGTFDEEGLSAAVPPFTNSMYGSLAEAGRAERCQASHGKVILPANAYVNHVLQGDRVIFEYELVTRIPAGPFMLGLFPKLGSAVTGNSIQCLPYIQDLSVEVSYHSGESGPLIDWFAVPTSSFTDARADRVLQGYAANNSHMVLNPGVDGLRGPQLGLMWDTAVTGSIENNAAAYVGILQPRMDLQWIEPDFTKASLVEIYTVSAPRFITYQHDAQIAVEKTSGTAAFEHLKIEQLSQLYIAWVEPARTTQGGAIGPKQSRLIAGVYNPVREGMSSANMWCPIDWNTLRLTLSVKNSVLGNISDEMVSQKDQYRVFCKYSKSRISFENWKRYRQCVIFSPQEMSGALGYSGSYAALTMALSFDFRRHFALGGFSTQDYFAADNAGMLTDGVRLGVFGRRNLDKAVNYTVRLAILEQSLLALSEGAAGLELVRFSNQEADAQFRRTQTSTLDEPILDDMINIG
jgi:hypothetical protein